MVVRFRIIDAEADGDRVEKGGAGGLYLPALEVIADMEYQFPQARPEFRLVKNGPVAASVGIGEHGFDRQAFLSQGIEFDPDPGGRHTVHGIEHMGGQAAHEHYQLSEK